MEKSVLPQLESLTINRQVRRWKYTQALNEFVILGVFVFKNWLASHHKLNPTHLHYLKVSTY